MNINPLTEQLPWILKNSVTRNITVFIIASWMAVYPIYNSYYKANGVEHYQRHLDHVAGKSMFFNPWQYRMLCPLLIEGTYAVAENTIFRIVDVKGVHISTPGAATEKNGNTAKFIASLQNPEFVKYTLVFVAFRYAQNMLIFYLCFVLFSTLVRSRLLVIFGLMLVAILMGNGVMDADLTFNTYMDITLYLLAALVIIRRKSAWWIVPITLAGAMNRETSLMIPALYFFCAVTWTGWRVSEFLATNKKVILVSAASTLVFFTAFVLIRNHYGYQPPAVWRVPVGLPMVKLNLLSSVAVKTYMEQFGMFGFLPLWCLLIYRQMTPEMKVFFILLVPVWFAVHLSTAMGFQTRLYLVPTLLVMLPAVLRHLEQTIIAASRRQSEERVPMQNS